MTRDGQKDFDFLVGSWKVRNRRLRGAAQGLDAVGRVRRARGGPPRVGSLANMDEYEGHAPFGLIQGMTVRLYDTASGQWRLHWANRATGVFDTPMVGRFEERAGRILQPRASTRARRSTRASSGPASPPPACRWEQALSPDGGKTWETNWIMEMTRWER